MAEHPAYTDLRRRVAEKLTISDTSARAAALSAGLPIRAVQAVLEGHEPSVGRAFDVAKALDLEFYIGPPRDPNTSENLTTNTAQKSEIPEIANALGLPPEASANEILAAITALAERAEQASGGEERWSQVQDALTTLLERQADAPPAGHYPIPADRGNALLPPAGVADKSNAYRLAPRDKEDEERWVQVQAELAALREAIAEGLAAKEPPATYRIGADLDDPAALAVGATNDDPGPATRLVEVVELRAAAGSGAEVLNETVVGQLGFQRQWLDRHAIDPTQAVMINVQGESMEPTLPDGCSVLVDRARRRRLDGHVYVLRTGDGIIVKRLEHTASGWQIVSDHPAWKPTTWTNDTEVIGEVCWAARSFKYTR